MQPNNTESELTEGIHEAFVPASNCVCPAVVVAVLSLASDLLCSHVVYSAAATQNKVTAMYVWQTLYLQPNMKTGALTKLRQQTLMRMCKGDSC